MSEINMKMFKDAEDSRGVIEINQIMNEMITKVDNIMTLDEFKSFCNELISDITNYKETIECLM